MNNTTMSQQEILNDLLNTEKSLVKLYASNITESFVLICANSCSHYERVLVGPIHCF